MGSVSGTVADKDTMFFLFAYRKKKIPTFDGMTTLENSYCVPRTDEEWAAIDALNPRIELRIKGGFVYTLKEHGKRRLWVCHREKGNAKEIPASRFLDLWHDRIVPWRLEEVGFKHVFGDTYTLHLEHEWDGLIVTRKIIVINGVVSLNGDKVNITTFTDLLKLIGFLTPPSND